MIELEGAPSLESLTAAMDHAWELSARKLRSLEARWQDADGAPVFTRGGRWATRAWTEWTLGFRFGSLLLQAEATGDEWAFELGRRGTLEKMNDSLTHTGVHDHGFQVVSTHGNLWRRYREGSLSDPDGAVALHELALRVSGAVQAHRYTDLGGGRGFVHSFNGPHSLFADTMRSLRSLALAHRLGQVLLEERDRRVSLLDRALTHARRSAEDLVHHGEGRDVYDVRGRVAHEAIYDVVDGSFRCLSSQQGYSPFTTWTRAQAWVVLGAVEQLEFVATCTDEELAPHGGRAAVEAMLARMATAAADHFLDETPPCGIPYWDTGAPRLPELGDWRRRRADPFNGKEPVDSSAAAIQAQGLLRLGRFCGARSDTDNASRYAAAARRILATLLAAPYLGEDPEHEGLLLHGVYHRPGGWDHCNTPGDGKGPACPSGEAVAWGDYHFRELLLCAGRLAKGQPLPHFFGPLP